jgi:hypothetical protein
MTFAPLFNFSGALVAHSGARRTHARAAPLHSHPCKGEEWRKLERIHFPASPPRWRSGGARTLQAAPPLKALRKLFPVVETETGAEQTLTP